MKTMKCNCNCNVKFQIEGRGTNEENKCGIKCGSGTSEISAAQITDFEKLAVIRHAADSGSLNGYLLKLPTPKRCAEP